MSVHSVSLQEAEGHLADLIQLADQGDEVVITYNNGRIVKLVKQASREDLFGLYEGKIRMSNDFDDELPDSFWFGENDQ